MPPRRRQCQAIMYRVLGYLRISHYQLVLIFICASRTSLALSDITNSQGYLAWDLMGSACRYAFSPTCSCSAALPDSYSLVRSPFLLFHPRRRSRRRPHVQRAHGAFCAKARAKARMGWSVHALTERQLGAAVVVSAPIPALTTRLRPGRHPFRRFWQGRGGGHNSCARIRKGRGGYVQYALAARSRRTYGHRRSSLPCRRSKTALRRAMLCERLDRAAS